MASGSGKKVLIVEDDRNTAALVATYLEREGFQPIQVHDGQEGLERARRESPMFVVLDVMLPKMDGWEVCRQLRRESDVPILMLTAREEEIDRVMGLSIGADDYVVKPFSPRELVERVKAILRRSGQSTVKVLPRLTWQGLEMDLEKFQVRVDQVLVELTAAEFKLLHALMKTPGKVFSRGELLSHLYDNPEAVVEKVVDVHIGKIRQKVESDPAHPVRILTVRGFGYRLAEEE